LKHWVHIYCGSCPFIKLRIVPGLALKLLSVFFIKYSALCATFIETVSKHNSYAVYAAATAIRVASGWVYVQVWSGSSRNLGWPQLSTSTGVLRKLQWLRPSKHGLMTEIYAVIAFSGSTGIKKQGWEEIKLPENFKCPCWKPYKVHW